MHDPGVVQLATRQEQSNTLVAAMRRLKDWIAVYFSAAPFPATFIRRLAQKSGVHLYTTKPDCLVFANVRYLVLAAPERNSTDFVKLPRSCSLTDASTGEEVARNAKSLQVRLRPQEVRLFNLRRIGNAGEV